jgi:hypothetical protein
VTHGILRACSRRRFAGRRSDLPGTSSELASQTKRHGRRVKRHGGAGAELALTAKRTPDQARELVAQEDAFGGLLSDERGGGANYECKEKNLGGLASDLERAKGTRSTAEGLSKPSEGLRLAWERTSMDCQRTCKALQW